ncbi:MAG: ribosome recycling factor [Patescibacteria group bacterium]|nr:ribosome recycling factor [Patescibacteria group bacterium]
MVTEEQIQKAKTDFQKAIEHLRSGYSKLQIGRASTSIVESVQVEAYGATQPLKTMANISVPDPRTISIQPWDKSILSAIEKAVRASDLGLAPINDGAVVRINIPPLTEERRRDLSKVVFQMAEDARISVRNARQIAHSKFKELKESSEITEDDMHGSEKRLQVGVDEANKKIDELAKKKEGDIMTI